MFWSSRLPAGLSLSRSLFLFSLFCSKAFHTTSARQNHTHTFATTHLAERIAILLFTYIIGDILDIYTFGHFKIRHHQTCYTVSLSPKLPLIYASAIQIQLVKYLKQGIVRDAHTHARTHTYTYVHAHMRHAPTHILYHVHQEKHSGIACQCNSLRAARWLVYEGHGMLKMSFFFFHFLWVDLHTPSPTGRSRTQDWDCANTQVEEDTCACVWFCKYAWKKNKYTERTSTLHDLYLSADLCVCACGGPG